MRIFAPSSTIQPWSSPPPAGWREPFPELAGTRVSVSGRGVMLQAEDLQRTLTALLGWADSRNVVLGALDARSTSLQEAFLAVAASSGEPVSVNDNGEGVAA